jgi:hypothetical protein
MPKGVFIHEDAWNDYETWMLTQLYPTVDHRFIAAIIGRTEDSTKSRVTFLKLKKQVRENDRFPGERLQLLIKLYPTTTNAEIAARLNVSEGSVTAKAFKLGLKKSREFMLMHSSVTAFKIGAIPANKGKKMSKELYAKAAPTMFKKGQIPHNALHFKDGDITVRVDHKNRGGKQYKWIRLSIGKWDMLQVHNWKKKYGHIPTGMCLWCKDGDTLNCETENWELITRAENLRRNNTGPDGTRSARKLTDRLLAFYIVGRNNMHLLEEVMKDKKLLEVKRQQLILKNTSK